MSLDHYHFQMVLRQQETTRTQRIAADAQLGQMAAVVTGFGETATRAAAALRRAVTPDPRRRQPSPLPRRNA